MRPPERTEVANTNYKGPERRAGQLPAEAEHVQPVILTRKLADAINDIDLSGRRVGDRLPLTTREARLLIAEGWAEPPPAAQLRRR